MAGDAQPVAFHFRVAFPWIAVDTSFSEVSGISSEMETEEYREGGENSFAHRLPKGVKHSPLLLKRGVLSMKSPLAIWCKAVLDTGLRVPIVPTPMSVMLLDSQALPLRMWAFTGAYPIKWSVDPFEGKKNELAIEQIEMSYNQCQRVM